MNPSESTNRWQSVVSYSFATWFPIVPFFFFFFSCVVASRWLYRFPLGRRRVRDEMPSLNARVTFAEPSGRDPSV